MTELVSSNQNDQFLTMVEKLASSPDVDVSKLEKILDVQERVMNKNALSTFNSQFSKMQCNIPVISENATAHNSRYATFEHIMSVIKPILKNYGFAIRFSVTQENGYVTSIATISHTEGHSESTSITLPYETSGSKNGVQAIGSSVSYGKRYALCALLGIATGDDDDGNTAIDTITEEQAQEINKLASKHSVDMARFLKYMKASSVHHIKATDYNKAITALNKKGDSDD